MKFKIPFHIALATFQALSCSRAGGHPPGKWDGELIITESSIGQPWLSWLQNQEHSSSWLMPGSVLFPLLHTASQTIPWCWHPLQNLNNSERFFDICAVLSWKGTGGPGSAWWGAPFSMLALCSALTIFHKKRETKTYETQKCSACVNSYIRENKNLLQHLQRAGLIINTKFLSFLQNYFSY